MRIPEERLTNRRAYLDPLNFATNFALFRDTGALHSRVVTVNYWAGYGSAEIACWLTLFDGNGEIIAEWCERAGNAIAALTIDSREVRARFKLGDFAGQLFIHVAGAAGHDVVKYALDTFGESGLSQTAPCPAPTTPMHGPPTATPACRPLPQGSASSCGCRTATRRRSRQAQSRSIRWARKNARRLPSRSAPFASRAIDVAELLPGLAWPRQIEVRAGKHIVRPRYEVVADGHRRIAHVNVERADLKPNPELPELGRWLGKGYLLPAPILPRGKWQSLALPTPMALSQAELPIAAIIYDPDGREVARHAFGRLPRDHAAALSLDEIAEALGDGYGHVELVYDFAAGGDGDGWLHALFRYRHRDSGHAAETSFGAHVFNTLFIYRDEPQSYIGRPPGLSTRLFLRLGEAPYDTLCHLIYPASRPWRPESTTEITLYDGSGAEIARTGIAIPCSGSRLLRYHALFDAPARERAGASAYAIIRDATCRLFGYHGLLSRGGAFSFDHMFGF